jgi:hypothetical protein
MYYARELHGNSLTHTVPPPDFLLSISCLDADVLLFNPTLTALGQLAQHFLKDQLHQKICRVKI